VTVRVEFLPESETDLLVYKPCWSADNGYETAVFPTKEEAIAFCWTRWRVPADQVRVVGEPARAEAGMLTLTAANGRLMGRWVFSTVTGPPDVAPLVAPGEYFWTERVGDRFRWYREEFVGG
jgi:hypothetical protein